PLKLITFNAVKINSSMANLSWELAGVALPGASFEVEKSADGRSFTSFSALPASTTNRFYFLNDTRLGKGVTYYRLKMIDADGKITYGKVVAVINDKTGIYITNIAPNPLTDRSTLTLSAAKAGTVTFEVYSLSGVVVKRWNAAVAEGTNIITMQAGELPAGIYQLVATGQEARAVTRFVKQ
ncbi:MAG: T9SS type A sorting domain-containing protein, partial [Chitinophagaceae bacterium]|nr:T9SS type A sorting domain-containing protein [Chitinophagaceae bacterium]